MMRSIKQYYAVLVSEDEGLQLQHINEWFWLLFLIGPQVSNLHLPCLRTRAVAADTAEVKKRIMSTLSQSYMLLYMHHTCPGHASTR